MWWPGWLKPKHARPAGSNAAGSCVICTEATAAAAVALPVGTLSHLTLVANFNQAQLSASGGPSPKNFGGRLTGSHGGSGSGGLSGPGPGTQAAASLAAAAPGHHLPVVQVTAATTGHWQGPTGTGIITVTVTESVKRLRPLPVALPVPHWPAGNATSTTASGRALLSLAARPWLSLPGSVPVIMPVIQEFESWHHDRYFKVLLVLRLVTAQLVTVHWQA